MEVTALGHAGLRVVGADAPIGGPGLGVLCHHPSGDPEHRSGFGRGRRRCWRGRDGDRVLVDGDNGTVDIVETAAGGG